MENPSALADTQHFQVAAPSVIAARRNAGRWILIAASLGLVAVIIFQIVASARASTLAFGNWRPILYAYVVWAIIFGVTQVLRRGERGQQALFVLPAILFTAAVV